jgi:hypothetical protein
MELHRIDTYPGLDNIQQQIRKKALWLNFTTERSVLPSMQ